jgi:hypothetical protein
VQNAGVKIEIPPPQEKLKRAVVSNAGVKIEVDSSGRLSSGDCTMCTCPLPSPSEVDQALARVHAAPAYGCTMDARGPLNDYSVQVFLTELISTELIFLTELIPTVLVCPY